MSDKTNWFHFDNEIVHELKLFITQNNPGSPSPAEVTDNSGKICHR